MCMSALQISIHCGRNMYSFYLLKLFSFKEMLYYCIRWIAATVTSLTFHNHDGAVYVCKTLCSFSLSCYDSNVTTEVLFDCIN